MTKAFRLILVLVSMLFGAQAAHAALLEFTAFLDGPSESPPNASLGTGFADIDIDTIANTMRVQAEFSGLLSPTIAAHIHCCTAVPNAGTIGVATAVPTFPGFPLGVTDGIYDQTFDLTLASSFNPAFVTANGGTSAGAEAALIAGLLAERAYFNIHTSQFPAGEIRGFLAAPEPRTTSLLALALGAGLMALRRGHA